MWQDAAGVHPELAKINYIFFQESNDFNTALQLLLEALDTDLAHVKEHTRFLILALEWDRKKRNGSYLLQGSHLNRDTIDGLIPALKAGKKLKELDTAKVTIPNQERAKVMTVLGQAI